MNEVMKTFNPYDFYHHHHHFCLMDDEDYSDLTDIESDDDQFKKKSKNSGPKERGGYRIKKALKVPRATTYTAQALYDQIHNCDINLEPEYQRDVVWPESKQIGIIDSIFRNFYIPPVIFAANSFEDGSETKTCIDGKQRLTSIHRFMDGLIPHKDPISGEKWWFKDVPGLKTTTKTRRILPEKLRKLFVNKQIVCVEYQDITDADEREIFQRVQLGMALTPAEKLQVINTPRAAFIRELQTLHLKEEGGLSGEGLEWDRSRGSDFRGIAQAVWCMDKLPSLKSVGSHSQLEKWLSASDAMNPTFRTKVQDTFRIFSDLVQDPKLNKVFKKPAKVSPVEFVFISTLICAHKDKFSMPQLSAAIGQMRDDVRQKHVDIRMNTRVSRCLMDFIGDLAPAKVAGDLGIPAGFQAGGEKRKRKAVDDREEELEDGEDDEEYQPKTKKKAGASSSKPDAPKSTPRTASKPSSAPAPSPSNAPTSRLAVLRATKESLAMSRAAPSPSKPPTIPQKSSTLPAPPSSMGTEQPVPPMLPSPGHQFTFPSSSFSHQQQQQHSIQQAALQQPSLPSPTIAGPSLEASLMAAMRQPEARRQDHAPPPRSASASGYGDRAGRPYDDRPGSGSGRYDGRYENDRGPGWTGGGEYSSKRATDNGWPARR